MSHVIEFTISASPWWDLLWIRIHPNIGLCCQVVMRAISSITVTMVVSQGWCEHCHAHVCSLSLRESGSRGCSFETNQRPNTTLNILSDGQVVEDHFDLSDTLFTDHYSSHDAHKPMSCACSHLVEYVLFWQSKLRGWALSNWGWVSRQWGCQFRNQDHPCHTTSTLATVNLGNTKLLERLTTYDTSLSLLLSTLSRIAPCPLPACFCHEKPHAQ